MADAGELNRIFMQVGELIGSIDALHEKLDSRAAWAESQTELVQAELRKVNSDLLELKRKHDAAVHLLASDVSLIKNSHEVMAGALKELQGPVMEIVTLRARAVGALFVLGPIGAAVLYFAPEIWKGLWRIVDAWFRSRST